MYCISQLVSVSGAGAALMAAFARKALIWGAEMRTEAMIEGGSGTFYSRVGASDYVETNLSLPWHGPVAREGDPYAPVWNEDESPTRMMVWSQEALMELAGAGIAALELA